MLAMAPCVGYPANLGTIPGSLQTQAFDSSPLLEVFIATGSGSGRKLDPLGTLSFFLP